MQLIINENDSLINDFSYKKSHIIFGMNKHNFFQHILIFHALPIATIPKSLSKIFLQ